MIFDLSVTKKLLLHSVWKLEFGASLQKRVISAIRNPYIWFKDVWHASINSNTRSTNTEFDAKRQRPAKSKEIIQLNQTNEYCHHLSLLKIKTVKKYFDTKIKQSSLDPVRVCVWLCTISNWAVGFPMHEFKNNMCVRVCAKVWLSKTWLNL